MKKLPWQHELRHHGVLGQKWGRRNGPPYPLAPGRHSAAEKKAGWQKSLDNKSRSQGNIPGGGGGGKKPDELTEEEKKMLEKFYKDLEEHLEWLKERHGEDVSPLEMISSQNFGLTLGEISGYELTAEQEEKFRKAAFDHYSKNSTQKNLHESNYAMNEGVLKLDQVSREAKKDNKILNNLYTELDKESKRLGKSPLDMLTGQYFGITLAEQLGLEEGESDWTPADIERLRKKAFDHYSKNSTERNLREAAYQIDEEGRMTGHIVNSFKKQREKNGSNELVVKNGNVYKRTVNNGVTVDTPVNSDSNVKKVIDNNITIESNQDATENKDLIDKAKKWINDNLSGTISYKNKDD